MNTKHWYPILKKPQFKLDLQVQKYIDMKFLSI